MTFINELIPENDKHRIDWARFKAWPHSTALTPLKWTIDRERNTFLVPLGGEGPDRDRPEVYALYWKGFVIRFEAVITGSGNGKFWDTFNWKIRNISIPEELVADRDQIQNLMIDAIRGHGRFFNTENIISVHVDFIQ